MINTKEELIAAFENPEEFERLVNTSYDLTDAVLKFPEYKEQLIKPVIENPDEFQRLVKGSYDLTNLTNRFPEHKEQLIKPVVENLDEFQRIIKSSLDLTNLAIQLPEYKEQLIKPVIENPDEFQRLVKSSFDIKNLKNRFPGHDDILNNPTIEKALDVIKLKSKESRAYIRGATAGALSNHFPADVNKHIGSFLGRKEGGRLAQTKKDANQLAKDEVEKEKIIHIKPKK